MKTTHETDGFTLAELLIVVAIIAILVSVSIPIFTSQLEKARESTDVANFRAAKAFFIAEYLQGVYDGDNEQRDRFYDVSQGILLDDFELVSQSAYGCGTKLKGHGEDFFPNYFVEDDYTDAIIICSYQPTGGRNGSEALFMYWALNREEGPIGGTKGIFTVDPYGN